MCRLLLHVWIFSHDLIRRKVVKFRVNEWSWIVGEGNHWRDNGNGSRVGEEGARRSPARRRGVHSRSATHFHSHSLLSFIQLHLPRLDQPHLLLSSFLPHYYATIRSFYILWVNLVFFKFSCYPAFISLWNLEITRKNRKSSHFSNCDVLQ